MKTKTKTMLVTGGGGFIGSHIVHALARGGYRVYSIDSYISTGGKLLKERKHACVNYIRCDIRNLHALRRHMMHIRPDVIFHTAALARIQPSIKDPLTYEETNAGGTLKLLLCARDAGVRRVVYSASSSAYGVNKIPFRETMTPDPLNPYAKTKLDGEQWMKIFSELYDVETVSLRYFNVYGPGNLYNGPYTTVIALFLHHMQHGLPMEIVGDGKQTRDYTHVDDVVNANILASQSKKVGNGEVINIGYGKRYSVNQIAKMIGGKAIYIPSRKGESHDTLADNRRAALLIGWKPAITLPDGVRALID